MKNELIQTDGVWYKIKRFFKNLFSKKKESNVNQVEVFENKEVNNNLKEKFEIENNKKELADKLLCGEILTCELNEKETDDMLEYFKNDINNIDTELEKIKKHILFMKQELS